MADDTTFRNEDYDDGVQHGIDDNPTGDAEKGAVLGGLGGAATGAAAGAVAGPAGALLGAAIGGVAGAVASGLAVGAVDRVDNDDTITGIGGGATTDVERHVDTDRDTYDTSTYPVTNNAYDSTSANQAARPGDMSVSDPVPGMQSGGTAGTTTPYPGYGTGRGTVDEDLTLDRAAHSGATGAYDTSRDNFESATGVGNQVPGIQTGGLNADGSPDTRGVTEKAADFVTGDRVDDKTGKPL